MKKLLALTSLTVLAVQLALAFCADCRSTCNQTVGSVTTTSYWPINEVQKKVTASNPHDDCVFVWSPFSACSTLGNPAWKVLCYSYQQRWYSYVLGTWSGWSSDIDVNTTEC